MRTKTNFNAIQQLMAKYKPETRGIVNDQETLLIQDILELRSRDLFELNDIRDMAVALYGQSASKAEKEQGLNAMMDMMDAMSAVTAVIDMEKADRVAPDDEQAMLAMHNVCSKAVRYAVMDEDGGFMTTNTKKPFSHDPADARTWPRAVDAGTMAGYAERQFNRHMSVAAIRTSHVICHVQDPAAEDKVNQAAQAALQKGDDGDAGTDVQ